MPLPRKNVTRLYAPLAPTSNEESVRSSACTAKGALSHSSTKPEAGHFAKAGVAPGSELVELRLDDVSDYEVGQEIGADVFEAGESVDAIGTSKGKGFAGVMKRHNFKGQRATHGAHLVHRMPGSIGQCATPSRVFKGVKMAGRMGSERVTVQSLLVVQSDPEKQLMLVKGSVPGPKGSTVIIRNAVKKASVNA
jgi:large subunit ribosomal protein L3